MVLSSVIWNDSLEVGTAETILKTRSPNGTFCRNIKQPLCKLGLLRKVWIRGRLMVHSVAIWNNIWMLKLLNTFWKPMSRCHFQETWRVVYYVILGNSYTINNGTRLRFNCLCAQIYINFKLWQNNLFVQLNQ